MILNVFEPNYLPSMERARGQNKQYATRNGTGRNEQSYGNLGVLKLNILFLFLMCNIQGHFFKQMLG